MRRSGLLLVLTAVLWIVSGSGWAQPAKPPLTNWDSALDAVTRQLGDPRMDDAGFAALRSQLDRLRVEATQERERRKQVATATQAQLDSLGPAPAAGQPRESADIANSRRQLTVHLQVEQDSLKQADLALARIQSLQDRISDEARRQFTRQLSYRGPSPLTPEFWRDGTADIAAVATQVMATPGQWWSTVAPNRSGPITLLQVAVVILIALAARLMVLRPLGRHFGVAPELEAPAPARRTFAALISWLKATVLPVGVLWGCYGVLATDGWIIGLFGTMLHSMILALSIALLAFGLAYAVLSPRHPAWALIPLPVLQQAMLLRRVALFSVSILLVNLLVAPSRVPDFGIAGRNLVIAAVAVFLMAFNLLFADPRLWRPAFAINRPTRPLAWGMVVLNLLAGAAILLGYYSFAAFLSFGLLSSVLALTAYILIRVALRDGLNQFAEDAGTAARGARAALGLSGPLSTSTQLMLGFAAEIILAALLVAALLLSWGMSSSALFGYLRELYFGVAIGPVTLSLGDILAAIVVLIVGIAVTRFLSGGLNARLEQQHGIDPGVRNSMVTGLTYIGYLVAGLAAVAAVGLDLSNLAIIAGALSVGIGFGLQNIVNNFVSGLILLIERPVKVGDWVVVGDKEGYVRRINVRSTEIETFPRASVIIPNSELISSPVMNWTHRNRLGRVDLNIGFAYGSDAEKVRDMLLDCLKASPDVLSMPAPTVLFRDFGDSALVFTVRGFISDVERRIIIESDLRYAIYKASQQAGIEIPFPQHDVNLRDMGRIEALVDKTLGKKKPAAD